jgi:type I restriction enzyme S subunit
VEVGSWKYIEESEVDNTDDKKYFVRISNLSKYWMNYNSPKYITNTLFEELEDLQPKEWEILFSKDGTAWIAYLLREDIKWINSWWILRLQNISNIPSEYIEFILNSFVIQKEIKRQTNWALIQHLKINDALDLDIPLIWDEKINDITNKVKTSFKARIKSKQLLEVAKKAVEIYIENEEIDWLEFIEANK